MVYKFYLGQEPLKKNQCFLIDPLEVSFWQWGVESEIVCGWFNSALYSSGPRFKCGQKEIYWDLKLDFRAYLISKAANLTANWLTWNCRWVVMLGQSPQSQRERTYKP